MGNASLHVPEVDISVHPCGGEHIAGARVEGENANLFGVTLQLYDGGHVVGGQTSIWDTPSSDGCILAAGEQQGAVEGRKGEIDHRSSVTEEHWKSRRQFSELVVSEDSGTATCVPRHSNKLLAARHKVSAVPNRICGRNVDVVAVGLCNLRTSVAEFRCLGHSIDAMHALPATTKTTVERKLHL